MNRILYLENKGLEVQDLGTNSEDSVDYPLYGQKVAQSILKGYCNRGIVICGTGIGISIAANRFKNIRATLCTSTIHAEMARKHNNANVMAIGARLTKKDVALKCVNTFIKTNFKGGRHLRRINKI